MSSISASNGVVLATAMAAVSGTVLLLALRLQKQPSFSGAGEFYHHHHPRPCISLDGKKREKKNKRVHFAEDVMEPSGNGEEFRRRFQTKNLGHNRTSLKHEGGQKKIVRNYEGLPANRLALYSGILRDRGLHRVSYC